MKTRVVFLALLLSFAVCGGSAFAGTEGPYNTFYGQNAGRVTTGSSNTFIGASSGYSNTSANYNTFLGYWAGYNTTTGIENTFVGSDSGWANTSGQFNTFVGHIAGTQNTDGESNTFIGNRAGSANTTADNNTFVGFSAGVSNTTGYHNAFFGSGAGINNIDGHQNTFIGEEAGSQNTSASYNTFVGWQSGFWNTTGSSNAFFGYSAGAFNIDGYNNTFLGPSAGHDNSSGASNTFVGLQAGYKNTTGSTNTFIGLNAGYNNTIGQDNTFFGVSAGASNIDGSANIFIGTAAGYNETGSNKLYISNSDTSDPLIYGEFDNSFLKINGSLGVGTNPSSKLTVAGIIETTGGGVKFPDGTIQTSAAAAGSHTHSGADITSGIVSETVIDSAIARDSEVTYAINAHASRTDNPHSVTASQVGAADAVHTHSFSDITSGTVSEAVIDPAIARDTEVAAAVNAHASRTDNPHNVTAAQAGAAPALHDHDSRYYTRSESDSRFVTTSGGIISGDLSVGNNVSINGEYQVAGVPVFRNPLNNTFVGTNAGYSDSTGNLNTFSGNAAGYSNSTGSSNTFIGTYAGNRNTTGSSNTFIGQNAGWSNTVGGGNVFLGYMAGYYETGSNKLYIANSNTSNPLIYGEFNNNKVSINGTLTINDIVQSSDARFKKEVNSIGSALDKVLAMNGVSYEWKKEEFSEKGFPGGRHYGLLAQEVEKVIPEVVSERQDGYKGVAYTELIPVLIEAIKEQQKTINTLKDQQKTIAELTQKVSALEKELQLKGAVAMVDAE
jgi:hypothetical protein